MTQPTPQPSIDAPLYVRIGELARQMEQAVRDLHQMEHPDPLPTTQIPKATQQLQDLVAMTEEGTKKVMACAEQILDRHVPIQAALATHIATLRANTQADDSPDGLLATLVRLEALLTDDATRLLDLITHLSFQDLMAQRIRKIVDILQDVQRQLLKLVVDFRSARNGNQTGAPSTPADALLAQLETPAGFKQDMVDELLKQYGF